jgi:hypothetical protein
MKCIVEVKLRSRNSILVFTSLSAALLLLLFASPVLSEDEEPVSETQVIQAFTSEENIESDIVDIDEKTKHIVLFAMGVPLLILLLVTGGLGIAMGVYGKPYFLAHMVCAGMSITLAIAHAVVGIVWFYPF